MLILAQNKQKKLQPLCCNFFFLDPYRRINEYIVYGEVPAFSSYDTISILSKLILYGRKF
jgi:hypothetical protein